VLLVSPLPPIPVVSTSVEASVFVSELSIVTSALELEVSTVDEDVSTGESEVLEEDDA